VIPGKEYRPRELYRIAWRRRYTILVPAIAVTAACAMWVQSLPARYRSDALILVVPQRVPESYVRSTVIGRLDNRLYALALATVSRTRLEPIIQEFALYGDRRRSDTMQDLVERMRNDIDIDMVKADALRVSYVAPDGRTAMRVVERLVSQLIDESRRSRETLAEETNRFLETQLADARLRLVETEQRIETYRRRHADEMPAQLSGILQAQHNGEMRLQALLDSIHQDRDRRIVLERMLADTSTPAAVPGPAGPSATAVEGAPIGLPAAEELRHAEALLAELRARLTPRHPDVVRLARLTATLRQNAAGEPDVALPTPPLPDAIDRQDRHRDIRAELGSLDERITAQLDEEKRVREAVTDDTKRIDAMPARESELTELMRDYQTLQENYRGLLTKKEESRVAADLEHRQGGEQFKILDAPRVPAQPSSPNRARIDLIGVMAGLALGLCLAAALEWFDLTLRSESDVQIALDVPVVALIPAVARRRANRGQLFLWLPHTRR